MTKLRPKQQIPAIRAGLEAWWRRSRRLLPWRRRTDAYAIWISEVMLQQARVATVAGYYERFLERFPTVRALAEAPISAVLKAWEGMGYTHFRITMHAYECRHVSGRARPIACDALKWVRLADLDDYAFPKANHRIIAALRARHVR
jgi:A/G-specific adenine glycosylase